MIHHTVKRLISEGDSLHCVALVMDRDGDQELQFGDLPGINWLSSPPTLPPRRHSSSHRQRMVGTRRLPGVGNKALRRRILRSERQIIPATLQLRPREAHAPDRFDLEYLSGGAPLFAHASPQATNLVQQAQWNATPMGVATSFPYSTGGVRLLSSPLMFKDHQTPSLMPREAHAPDRFDLECLSGGVVSPIFAHASPQATKSVQQAQGNASQNASPMGVAPSFPDSTGGARLLSSPWMFTDREDTWTYQRHFVAAQVVYPSTAPRVPLQEGFTEEEMPTSYPPSDGARHGAFHGLVDGYLDSPAHIDFARVTSTEDRAFARLLSCGIFGGVSVSATDVQYFPERSLNAVPDARPFQASDQAACDMPVANVCGQRRGRSGPPACNKAIEFGRGHAGPHALFPEHLPGGSFDAVPTAGLFQDLKNAYFPESSLNAVPAASPLRASEDQAVCEMAAPERDRHVAHSLILRGLEAVPAARPFPTLFPS